jgi:hypothetical protein
MQFKDQEVCLSQERILTGRRGSNRQCPLGRNGQGLNDAGLLPVKSGL